MSKRPPGLILYGAPDVLLSAQPPRSVLAPRVPRMGASFTPQFEFSGVV